MNPIIGKVLSVVTGGVADKAMDIIDRQFPGKMSEQEREQLKAELRRLDNERVAEANRAAESAAEALNQRLAEYEGTAADVKGMFLIGPLIILIRSLFRPVASYTTVYLDYLYFTTNEFPEGADGLLLAINLIVLGFWFGERTIKNLMPLFLAWLDKREK